MEYRYPIGYKIEVGKFTRDELKNLQMGGCDSIVVHSIINNDDGTQGHMTISRNPAGDELEPHELWQTWAVFAYHLVHNTNLDAERRQICENTVKEIEQYLGKKRAQTPASNQGE